MQIIRITYDPSMMIRSRYTPKNNPTTFQEHLDTLAPWERAFLCNIKEKHTSRLSLKEHIQIGSKLWLVTAGGVTDGIGYFGWIIATDSFILWEGHGQPQGHPRHMKSLKAGSSGVLSVLRFLLKYERYFNVSITGDNMVHYCDNSTLCGRMQAMQQDQTITPTQTIQSDWDVHMAIDETV
eukprot:1584905-Ditylum_brightwellii.AAC.1